MAMSCVQQCDHNPPLYLTACLLVGLPPPGHQEAAEAFNNILRLHTKEDIDGDNKGG